LEDRTYAKGEVKLSGREGIVSHEIVGLHEKITLQFTHFLHIGAWGRDAGIEQISRIHEDDALPGTPQLLDERSSPGQTAKQIIPSAAGLDFAVNVG